MCVETHFGGIVKVFLVLEDVNKEEGGGEEEKLRKLKYSKIEEIRKLVEFFLSYTLKGGGT